MGIDEWISDRFRHSFIRGDVLVVVCGPKLFEMAAQELARLSEGDDGITIGENYVLELINRNSNNYIAARTMRFQFGSFNTNGCECS
jgi:hypothetical protein